MATRVIRSVSSLASRTVHLKLSPTPHAFPERREVLRMLERYGEVVMFRSLKYHPKAPVANAFIAIFATESAAQDLLSQSPVRYRILPPAPPSTPSEGTETDPEPKIEETGSIFQLDASPSILDHERFLSARSTNPRHGPYKPTKFSSVGASLSYYIPNSITSAGMLDWEPPRVGAEEMSNKREIERRASIPRIMKGLQALSKQYNAEEVD